MFPDLLEEFFAIEKMTARMVNNINGPTINDIPANIYIYILFLVILISWVCHKIYRFNKIMWHDAGRMALIIIFAFWALQEARTSLNYLAYLKDDSSMLWGKSLDEKRALTSPAGLYEFAQLVKNNTKPEDKTAILSPQNEFIDIKLHYFLAPYNRSSTAEAQYTAGYLIPPGNYKYFANTQYGWIVKTNKEALKP